MDETACRAKGSKDKDMNRASRQIGEKQADHVTSEQTVCQIRVEFASEAQYITVGLQLKSCSRTCIEIQNEIE